MSTQEAKFPSIPFSISQNLQNVRLLEVPEELLQIIANTKQNLYFKSSPVPSHVKNGAQGKEGNVHLCADDKVWAVKQVSTSNSIYVTRTSPSEQIVRNDGGNGADNDNKGMEVDGQAGDIRLGPGISAIAKPASILELHALPPATYETMVLDHLSDLVPTISSASNISITRNFERCSLVEIYNHIPAPASVTKRVLTEKCAFEIPPSESQPSGEGNDKLQAYIPSSRLLLSTWTEIMEVATLTGTQITGFKTAEILTMGANNTDPDSDLDTDMSEDQHTKIIHKAVSKRLFQEDGHLTSIGVMNKDNRTLNDRECTRWVGNLMLAAAKEDNHNNGSGLPKDDFEKKWEDNVPANWIKYCSVEVLRPACELTTVDGTDMVRWAPFALEKGDVAGNGTAGPSEGKPGSGAAAGGTKNKRKWHEKFAAQRNVKK